MLKPRPLQPDVPDVLRSPMDESNARTQTVRSRPSKALGQPKRARAGKRATSLPTLRKKAWAAFSKYIRYRDAGGMGFLFCICCEQPVDVKDAHAAHFIHCSKQSALSYDERNIHGCCAKCNVYLHGNLIPYTLYMQRRYGQPVIDELMAMKHSKSYLKRAELEEIYQRYKEWALLEEIYQRYKEWA